MTAPRGRRPGASRWRAFAPSALLAVAVALLGGCASQPLGNVDTALERLNALVAAGDTEGVAELGGRIVESKDASPEDRAEAAFLAGEAEFELGEDAKAFQRYRYVLENAPWSKHAAAIENRLFEIGNRFLFGEEYSGWFADRARGVEVLETLQMHFRTSDRADDALKLVGDYFSRPDVAQYGEASLVYERVAEEYPESEWAERCLWLAGHCNLRVAGGPKYDRNDLLRAKDLLERSLQRYPKGVAAKESQADLTSTVNQLAEAELYVADFYLGHHVPFGEQLRLVDAALLYPQTFAGQEARARLLAMNIDPESLRNDPRRQSLDTVKVSRPVWAQAKEKAVDKDTKSK